MEIRNKDMWRDIPGYPQYSVSRMGEVYSKRKNIILKPSISQYGYARVTLYCASGEKHKIMIHQLVAKAFLENPNSYPQVNHKNENKLDNRLENLEWCSVKYNINYGNRNIIVSKKLREAKEKTSARKIEQIDIATGQIVKTWISMRAIERNLGFSHSNIYACCSGKRKTRGGFIWRYAT